MENDRQSGGLVRKIRDALFFFFFLFSFPFIRFVSREEASCCQGGRPRGAAGKIKGGGSACRTVDREKKHFFLAIWPLHTTF